MAIVPIHISNLFNLVKTLLKSISLKIWFQRRAHKSTNGLEHDDLKGPSTDLRIQFGYMRLFSYDYVLNLRAIIQFLQIYNLRKTILLFEMVVSTHPFFLFVIHIFSNLKSGIATGASYDRKENIFFMRNNTYINFTYYSKTGMSLKLQDNTNMPSAYADQWSSAQSLPILQWPLHMHSLRYVLWGSSFQRGGLYKVRIAIVLRNPPFVKSVVQGEVLFRR